MEGRICEGEEGGVEDCGIGLGGGGLNILKGSVPDILCTVLKNWKFGDRGTEWGFLWIYMMALGYWAWADCNRKSISVGHSHQYTESQGG